MIQSLASAPSNIFKRNGIPYFNLPHTIIDNIHSLSEAQIRFLCFFHRETQKHNMAELTFTKEEIREGTGVRPARLAEVRDGLVELGMLQVRKVGSTYFYGLVQDGK